MAGTREQDFQASGIGPCTPVGSGEGICALVYRSRATEALTPPELLQLTLAAQARNRLEAVTGVMLYDDRQFFQWLEGPRDSVGRIMESIEHDPRHSGIEIIDRQVAGSRVFGDWSMKLAASGAKTPIADVIEPPADIIETLRAHPADAPSLLVKLVPLPDAGRAADTAFQAKPQGRVADILREVMLRSVIPHLAGQHGILSGESIRSLPSLAREKIEALADLLVSSEPDAAMALIGELRGSGALAPLYNSLFEPTARRLGDLWTDGDCSELDVTLGLCRLQAASRLFGAPLALHAPAELHPLVLVAPEPGELHRLSAALDCDILEHAGWLPQRAYPASDAALQDLLAGTWFDALDLSLSPAFRREHRLAGLAETIARARRASRNPALMVIVAGRVFVEEKVAPAVGADFTATTSLNVDRSILAMLRSAAPGTRPH